MELLLVVPLLLDVLLLLLRERFSFGVLEGDSFGVELAVLVLLGEEHLLGLDLHLLEPLLLLLLLLELLRFLLLLHLLLELHLLLPLAQQILLVGLFPHGWLS